MKIENNKINNQVKFRDIKIGDCFEYADELFLKTPSIFDGDAEIQYNSVGLNDGYLSYFDEFDWVKNINAKVVIE